MSAKISREYLGAREWLVKQSPGMFTCDRIFLIFTELFIKKPEITYFGFRFFQFNYAHFAKYVIMIVVQCAESENDPTVDTLIKVKSCDMSMGQIRDRCTMFYNW